jgi:hypothetical protein
MLRALLGTLLPTRRERTVEFELPKIESAADAVKASSASGAAEAATAVSTSAVPSGAWNRAVADTSAGANGGLSTLLRTVLQ